MTTEIRGFFLSLFSRVWQTKHGLFNYPIKWGLCCRGFIGPQIKSCIRVDKHWLLLPSPDKFLSTSMCAWKYLELMQIPRVSTDQANYTFNTCSLNTAEVEHHASLFSILDIFWKKKTWSCIQYVFNKSTLCSPASKSTFDNDSILLALKCNSATTQNLKFVVH